MPTFPVIILLFTLSAFSVLGVPGEVAAQAQDVRSASDVYAPISRPWTRVRSPNFTVLGDVGEKRLRDVAQRLEQFRDVMNGALPQAVKALPVPVTVVAFTHSRDFQGFNRNDFEALAPERGGPGGALMVVGVQQKPLSDDADASLYYEYTRLAISKAYARLPLWLEAGLTNYFATFRMAGDGRTARVGLPIDEMRRRTLQTGRPIPLMELVAAGRDMQLSAADKMSGRFSAQCWALVHYLQIGSPARAGQAKAFMQRLANGEEGVAAFNASFPDAGKLELEVLDYVNKYTFSYQEMSFAQPLAGGLAYSVSRMTDAEVEAVRGCVNQASSTK
jgi:hypothetical protein